MRLFALVGMLALGCRGTSDDTSDPVDADGDGTPAAEDCNDDDATAYPGATETCDGVDNDCDGAVDDEATDASSWYADADGDGYGGGVATTACDAPTGHVADGTDCDDAQAAVHPGASEDDCADPTDYNCDGSTGFADADGDDVPACEDCDDADATVGDVDAGTFYADADGDGFGDAETSVSACAAPTGYVTDATDCDDAAASAYPGATEACGGGDEDCDGETDEAGATGEGTFYTDGDGDGYGSGEAIVACEAPTGAVTTAGDCDDASASSKPGGTEACGGGDEDCDGETDEAGATGEGTFYTDGDGDGYGDPLSEVKACAKPSGAVEDKTDCDDAKGAVHPGAAEACDSVDSDCDGDARDAESTDAKTFYLDGDGDTYGKAGATKVACDAPTGYVEDDTDCDDGASDVNPGATPVCDGVDHDCDTVVDDDLLLGTKTCGAASCSDLLAKRSDADDGYYWIDADPAFEVYCDMTTAGGGWTRVYYQDTSKGEFFAQGQAEINRDDPRADLYAILEDLDALKAGSKYEFLMRWPEHPTFDKYQHWKQASNPVTDSNGALPTGYEAIDAPYAQNGWSAGLQKSLTQTWSLLDGTLNPLNNWYYAVGTTYCWGNQTSGCQPAPTGGAHIAELYIR